MSRAFTLSLSTVQGWNQPQLSASSSRVIPERGCPSPLGVRAVGTVAVFPVAPPPECDLARPLTVLHHQARARRREIDSHVSSLGLRRRALLQKWRHDLQPSSTIETRTGLRLESTVEMRTGLSQLWSTWFAVVLSTSNSARCQWARPCIRSDDEHGLLCHC